MKYVAIVMAAFLIYPFTVLSASAQRAKPPLVVGVDANYAEGMERELGLHWQWDRERRDLFQEMNTRCRCLPHSAMGWRSRSARDVGSFACDRSCGECGYRPLRCPVP